MNEEYIRGINSELIRTLKKLIEATGNQQQAVIDKLTEISAAITGKLDEVIANQQEINITADTINLNTDTLETLIGDTNDKLDTAQATLNSINGAAQYLNGIGTGVTTIASHIPNMDTNGDLIAAHSLNTANWVQVLGENTPYLNPTHLAVVAEGDTTFDGNVVLCNITDNNITVSVTAADDTNAQSVVLTPGWNPVIVKAITGATANTLIYGW